ncbi:MAG TPA: ABC transporter ATP-binding protein [Armatimonadota bacterium]|jgi:subfamily B ATP-binding cassette protein MsbA
MRGLWSLRTYAKRSWKGLILALLLMGASAALNIGVLVKSNGVFTSLISQMGQAQGAEREQALRALLHALFIFGAAMVGAGFAQAGSLYMGDWLGQRVLFALRTDVFAHLQSLSMRFYENRRTGELISRLNNDTTMLQAVLGASLAELVVAPATALGVTIYMATVSWQLTLVMLVVGPTVALMTQQLGIRLRRYSHQVQSNLATMTADVDESFYLIRVIKMFGLDRAMIDRFSLDAREVYRAEMRGSRMRALNSAVVATFIGLALCAVLLFGAYQIMAGRIGPGTLITFMLGMFMVGDAINRLARVVMSLLRAEASATRTLSLLQEVPEIQDSPDAVTLEQMEGDIRFEQVSFAYEAGRPVLHDLDLHIKPGEVVAFVGPSGAGKTTVVGLVPRLYDVQAGRVLIDGHDVRDLKQESLRSFMGFVPQETMLFAGTIRENIAFARPEASFEEIQAATRAANAGEFIEALPEGYDTQVGEMGVKLSGGQKQRIAIARALLRNPRILILDEATSSLDQTSEQVVHQALSTLLQGRTALIIAHRLSTIRDADRIMVVNDGRIVEQGTHDELMARGGLYTKLYESSEAETGGPECAPAPPAILDRDGPATAVAAGED